jgi:transposase-like protein
VQEDQINGKSAPLSGGMPPERGAEADPEVVARPTRRRFSADEKARIVREADACTERGAIGALLRREGVYASHLASWRRQLRERGVEGLAAKKRGPAPKPKPSAREVELERKTRKLEKELAKAKAVIEFQKKVHELLGIPLKSHELDEDDS